jgi:hypothetical protein
MIHVHHEWPMSGVLELFSKVSGMEVEYDPSLTVEFAVMSVDIDTRGPLPWDCILLDLVDRLGLEAKIQEGKIVLTRP